MLTSAEGGFEPPAVWPSCEDGKCGKPRVGAASLPPLQLGDVGPSAPTYQRQVTAMTWLVLGPCRHAGSLPGRGWAQAEAASVWS